MDHFQAVIPLDSNLLIAEKDTPAENIWLKISLHLIYCSCIHFPRCKTGHFPQSVFWEFPDLKIFVWPSTTFPLFLHFLFYSCFFIRLAYKVTWDMLSLFFVSTWWFKKSMFSNLDSDFIYIDRLEVNRLLTLF